MPLSLLQLEMLLPAFMMVLARTAGAVVAVPMFSNAQIPAMVKVLLAVTLGFVAFPVVMPMLPTDVSLTQAATGLASEFLIGELLGLAAGAALFAAQMAGNVVSQQAGLSLGQVFNPMLDEETTVLDQLWFFGALMFFFAFRGHLAVVSALLGSFELVPPMSITFDAGLLDVAAGLATSMFEATLRLAGPSVLALLATSLVLGFLTKTMPQLNILSVGFAFKVAVGLVAVAATMACSGNLIADTAAESLDSVGRYWQVAAEGLTRGG
ncbi:flagellar biosynthesis protein FliR [Phycisphaerae bacterium RAS2]|nr:flagellar biosynthesis protein FliR [Phycisphaerae bacterium RAS2]